MTKKKQPVITPLRLPPELRAWVKSEAEKNHRSMNSEIITRLEQSQRITELLATAARRPESHEATQAEKLAQAIHGL